jgi:chromosomal replication initiator protein
LNQKEIDLELTNEALKDLLSPDKPKYITIPMIQKMVAQYYNLKIEDFKARRRTRTVAYPRQIAMYLARELTDASLPKIGQEFGGRDHTTVIHACDKIKDDMINDEAISSTVEEIIKRLQA